MGQLTLASGGQCRNWPGSGNGNFWDRTVISFEKSLARVPGAVVLINHLPPRLEQPKKPWAGAGFPRPAKSQVLFNLSSPPQPLSPLWFAAGTACSPSSEVSGAFLLTELRCLTLNQAVLLQNLVGLGIWVKSAIFLWNLKRRDTQQRAARGVCQHSWVSLLRIPFPGASLPAHKDAPPSPGTGLLPSPAAPGQPQITKANAYPALTPNFKWREVLHQQFIYRRLGKVFGTHPSALEKLLGTLPVIWPLWMEMS